MAKRSYIDIVHRFVDAPGGPWAGPLPSYQHVDQGYYTKRPPAPRRKPPNMRGTPTVDGPVVHPILGGGRKQRVPLPVYKSRRPRKS
jgi:hypothetical protein